jgi:hypothetical protein
VEAVKIVFLLLVGLTGSALPLIFNVPAFGMPTLPVIALIA